SLVEEAIHERQLAPVDDTLILVGASEMSAKVARFALRRGVKRFLLVRKNANRAMNYEMQRLMNENPNLFTVATLSEFKENFALLNAQAIVLASTATEPLFTAAELHRLNANQTLSENAAIVDLSLPANVADDVAEELAHRFISLSSLKKISDEAKATRAASALEAEPIIRRAVYQLWLDALYRENPMVVKEYLDNKTNQSDSEWQRLAVEASLSEKQKRIMYDFLKKEQRRTLQRHREMILDLIAGTSEAPSFSL
ncbi:MAG TPA: hypothetical protein PLY93_07530, partial [Turneriella sp.]|nr:hypothetical protein [Turneriella sp.]